MSDPMDHRIFDWRPEIRTRSEAKAIKVALDAVAEGLDTIPAGSPAREPFEAMQTKLQTARAEWEARPWWTRLVGRARVSDDAVTVGRWMEHARALSERQAGETSS